MLMNLFNLFDPMIMNLPLNWLYMFFFFLYIKNNIWLLNSNMMIKLNNFIIKLIYKNNYIMNKSLILLFFSLFNLIFLTNLNNLISFFFYISSNLMFTLNFSFLMIFMYLMFMINMNYKIFLMNLTPKLTPMVLICFINLIELNSFFIQIVTLSLRLMINMMMGHLIMIIINKMIFIFLYIPLEMFIIMIQSYVFFILNLLNSNNMY